MSTKLINTKIIRAKVIKISAYFPLTQTFVLRNIETDKAESS